MLNRYQKCVFILNKNNTKIFVRILNKRGKNFSNDLFQLFIDLEFHWFLFFSHFFSSENKWQNASFRTTTNFKFRMKEKFDDDQMKLVLCLQVSILEIRFRLKNIFVSTSFTERRKTRTLSLSGIVFFFVFDDKSKIFFHHIRVLIWKRSSSN